MSHGGRTGPLRAQASALLAKPEVQRARILLRERDEWVLQVQKDLTAIPAPSFQEGPRGQRMAEEFRALGLEGVHQDEAGNVLAWAPGRGSEPSALMVSAHLDTVFPPGTAVVPRMEGDRIYAPGISDDGRGLAALLALAWVVTKAPLPPLPPLLFVATVGEEGVGDLRGVRHLFREGGPGSGALGFISLDGVGLDRIIHEGVGSTRLRIRLTGPGGHSWTDWGLPNPIHGLGRIVAGVETLPLPTTPRTTATVARCGGGKSVNAIPQEAWMEVDLRSRGPEELLRLEEAFLNLCRREWGGTGPGRQGTPGLEVEELGRRPAGISDPDASLVQAALAATEALGVKPQLTASSTDANLPMSLGLPAVTLGAGGRAGGIHTLDEWYANEEGPEGIFRALLTLLVLGSEDGGQPTSE